jgi:polar amino acid transport system substrate-binding protein
VRFYPSADEYKLDLVNGRLDAVVDDVVVLSDWLATPDGACCKIVGTITPVPEIHGIGAGIAIRQGEDDLREAFNEAIEAIRANGTYQRINDEYFSFDVYGG